MKKLIIAASVLMITLSNKAVAQSADTRDDMFFALKGGLNHSNVWDEQGQDFTANGKTGFAAGIALSIPIVRILGIQPELMLSQKGFQGSGVFLGTSYAFSRTTTFLDVPILIQFKPTEAFTLVAGPQYSFLLNKKDVYNFGGSSFIDEENFENNNLRNNIFGVSVGFDIHVSHLMLSGRACWDLQHNNGDGTSNNPRYKNQWIQFTAGYRF